MKLLTLWLVCLALVATECALLRPFGLSSARADVHVAVIVFLALRCTTLEGAFGAFAAGYVVDALSGLPTGLYVFTSVLAFLIARLLAPFVDVKKAGAFALLAALVDSLHNLAVWGLALLGTAPEADRGAILQAIPLTAGLTAVAALVAWPLLTRAEALFKKPETGLLP